MSINPHDATPQSTTLISPWMLLGLILLWHATPMVPQPSALWPASQVTGHIWEMTLNEISGITPATPAPDPPRSHPPLFWAHNDSGDTPRLFLIDSTGALKGTLTLQGARVLDAEDLTQGPCEPGDTTRCVFLGDIGDNRHRRNHIHIYRFRAPAPAFEDASVHPEILIARYPGGQPHDAEALFVHPKRGELFVMQKSRDGRSRIYQVPNDAPWHRGHQEARAVTLKLVATLDLSDEPHLALRLVTAAEFSPTGDCLSMLTYRSVLTHCATGAWGGLEDLFLTPRDRVILPALLQAEALTYDPLGTRLWVTSERNPAPMLRLSGPNHALGAP